MHRHGYVGRKLSRETAQRKALIKGLAKSLIEFETIETTLPKAKEVLPFTEKLITKAKKNNLHNTRQIIAKLGSVDMSLKLVNEVAPKLSGRDSGHLRIEKTRLRRGDGAQMATVSFVDDLAANTGPKTKKASTKLAKKATATTAKAKGSK